MSFSDDLDAWLAQAWDPDLTVSQWWQRLAAAGYAAPTLPCGFGGRGLSSEDAHVVTSALAGRGALGPPLGVGLSLVAPTLVLKGTAVQASRFVPRIVDGSEAWCQLFSEPDAGSDLASLQTAAVRDGDEWVVDGQKVWTSDGHHADWGLLLARTDPARPGRLGITVFAFSMHQEGVVVEPLRDMTGTAEFSRVTISGARVPDSHRIGEVNEGWSVVQAALAQERSGYHPTGDGGLVRVHPGRGAGNLDRRAGDAAGDPASSRIYAISAAELDDLVDLARARERIEDRVVRQQLARLHTLVVLGRLHAQRGDFPGSANLAKLLFTATYRVARDVGTTVAGPDGMLADGLVPEITLFSPGPSIYGGTDQIQRNILAERVLGLPRDPRPPQNAGSSHQG
jgi:alkylation response protein AidB-like acyl-CoA dehydrogenase